MLECGKTKDHITQMNKMWNLWSVFVLFLNEESFLNYIWKKSTFCSSFQYVFIQNDFRP
jgi:hypothetical protein